MMSVSCLCCLVDSVCVENVLLIIFILWLSVSFVMSVFVCVLVCVCDGLLGLMMLSSVLNRWKLLNIVLKCCW